MRLVTPGAPNTRAASSTWPPTNRGRPPPYGKRSRIQLVFLDLGTPKAIDTVSTSNDEAAVIVDTETPEEVAVLTDVYADLKRKLTARGIRLTRSVSFTKRGRVKRASACFQAANDGLARVIIGSTAKLGTGVNVQKRLAALHHLDEPWRPMISSILLLAVRDSPCISGVVGSPLSELHHSTRREGLLSGP